MADAVTDELPPGFHRTANGEVWAEPGAAYVVGWEWLHEGEHGWRIVEHGYGSFSRWTLVRPVEVTVPVEVGLLRRLVHDSDALAARVLGIAQASIAERLKLRLACDEAVTR